VRSAAEITDEKRLPSRVEELLRCIASENRIEAEIEICHRALQGENPLSSRDVLVIATLISLIFCSTGICNHLWKQVGSSKSNGGNYLWHRMKEAGYEPHADRKHVHFASQFDDEILTRLPLSPFAFHVCLEGEESGVIPIESEFAKELVKLFDKETMKLVCDLKEAAFSDIARPGMFCFTRDTAEPPTVREATDFFCTHAHELSLDNGRWETAFSVAQRRRLANGRPLFDRWGEPWFNLKSTSEGRVSKRQRTA
jgi:hypothetical protein